LGRDPNLFKNDIKQRKLVTVVWHKVSTPLSECGFGIGFLSQLNEAANLELSNLELCFGTEHLQSQLH